MSFQAGVGARLGLAGKFECKDKDGNVLKVIEFKGSIPLEDLGIGVDEAQQLINQKEADRGPDDRKRMP